MTIIDGSFALDTTDWKLLLALQENARASFTALGQLIGLSRPAVAERVRRLEEAGIITGYRATLDLARLGRAITAFVRMHTNERSAANELIEVLQRMPTVQEAYRGTGGDCFTIKLVVQTIAELDQALEQLGRYGEPTTSIMLAPILLHRGLMNNSEEQIAADISQC